MAYPSVVVAGSAIAQAPAASPTKSPMASPPKAAATPSVAPTPSVKPPTSSPKSSPGLTQSLPRPLPASLDVLSDLSDQPLKWALSDQKHSALLVLPYLPQRYFLISLSATVPGRNLWGFFTPPVAEADFQAALVASCFLGALPPVDFRAVCLVRAIVERESDKEWGFWCLVW
ncbi:unnamed protein product [Camellia sinensis]